MQRKTLVNTTWVYQIIFVFVQICLLALHTNDLQAQSNVTDIVIPVSGKFAFAPGNATNSALIVDTATGEIENISTNPNIPLIWNPSGDKLAFRKPNADLAYYDALSNSIIEAEADGVDSRDILIYPQGWSADSQNIMYLQAIVGRGDGTDSPPITYSLHLFDWVTQTSRGLNRYQTNIPITDVPMYLELSYLPLSDISQIVRNPVRDEWTFIQFKLSDINEEEGTVYFIFVNVLWNYTTGQMISVDDLFPDPITPSPVTWSDDGKYLLIKTGGNSFKQHIVRFNTDNTLVDKDSAIVLTP